MKVTNVTAVYFSPTGSTKKIVDELSRVIADEHSISMHSKGDRGRFFVSSVP